ncbi:respiratory nitrate reductase subunit gamma [Thermodesulfobacteriota bacterium]
MLNTASNIKKAPLFLLALVFFALFYSESGALQPSDPEELTTTPHAGIECVSCHDNTPEFHRKKQKEVDCLTCHDRHGDTTTRDAHIGVTCQACHMEAVSPKRIPGSNIVKGETIKKSLVDSHAHDMFAVNDARICRRCHFQGNRIGAASMVLPEKGMLCAPCHAAIFSMGSAYMPVFLLFALLGLLITVSVWLSGSAPGDPDKNMLLKILDFFVIASKTVFSVKFGLIIRTLIFEVFLQRRLYRLSFIRWLIHGLIFFPLVFRFLWGIAERFASNWLLNQSIIGFLLDKNDPISGILFDMTGVMMVMGVVFASFRKKHDHPDALFDSPKQDRWSLILIGGIVCIGFILEGIRIAMTGWPNGSGYAVFGYGISLLFAGMTDLTDIYGYVWHVHSVLTGLLILYLPFSRLMHMIIAPTVLVMNAVTENGKN